MCSVWFSTQLRDKTNFTQVQSPSLKKNKKHDYGSGMGVGSNSLKQERCLAWAKCLVTTVTKRKKKNYEKEMFLDKNPLDILNGLQFNSFVVFSLFQSTFRRNDTEKKERIIL